ncbi:MAG: c-type cytochrome [Verrucomicrobiae bacterium]|nr:c-type cytochrome [Verrucomicrobiae bacterium]
MRPRLISKWFSSVCTIVLTLTGGGEYGLAISPDNAPASDNSVAAEQAAFQIHEDFEISLFADESLGIANPIAIQWDPRGRLWVLCTLAYAQLKPGELSDDKLFILEDRDGNGKADHSTMFADGLEMPTGFALGHGGVWLAEGPDLVFLHDTDGDDQADERKVILTGFGTGDTHQNISNLKFDAGGFLYFTQGLHAFSQVETPWGVARGDTAGFWRFNPRVTKLEPFGFPSMTSQNPAGVALDRWGSLFIKSNGPHLCFADPALIPTTHSRELMVSGQVGQTPGKSMGGAVVESSHPPDWIQHHAIIAGYFAREVSALPLVEEGSGFAVSKPIRLLYSEHPSFRPVDVLPGPDGAIYVADWFNPIINHYQVSLRHPDRDYSHGRIWRLTAKGRPLIEKPELNALDLEGWFEQLRSGERWTREQARRLLSDHDDQEEVASRLRDWVESELDSSNAADQLALVELAGIMESFGTIDAAMLDRLQASPNPQVRAAAARAIGRAVEPIADADKRLAALLADSHPRPRLEAVIACANRPSAESMKLALSVLDAGEMDRFVDYALGQAVFALEENWKRALEKNIAFFGNASHLAFVLETVGGEDAAGFACERLKEDLEANERSRLFAVLARFGDVADLRKAFMEGYQNDDVSLLTVVADASESRKLKPDEQFVIALQGLIGSKDELSILGYRLAGLWKVGGVNLGPSSTESSLAVSRARLRAMAEILNASAAGSILDELEGAERPEIKVAAMEALMISDAKVAAETAVKHLATEEEKALSLARPLLADAHGSAALAAALDESEKKIEATTAQALLNLMNQTGRSDPKLTPILNQIAGIESAAPEYDAERVQKIVAEIRGGKGDPEKGRDVYLMAQLSCIACHRVGDEGGVIGPALTNVGAGMPLDQIVESVLWPDRQIKEGFQAVSLTTKDGKAITGYLEREDDDLIWYRNTTAPWILPLEKTTVAERRNLPTLMPAGLTHSLSEEQFLDLIAYLASLKG